MFFFFFLCYVVFYMLFFFFFQAEDGIRDIGVTGVQTYALPISPDLWAKILHPEDRERVLAEDRHTNETGEPFAMEYRQFARDGSVVWLRDEATLVRDENGKPLYWLGVQVDITERRRAEEAHREAEER